MGARDWRAGGTEAAHVMGRNGHREKTVERRHCLIFLLKTTFNEKRIRKKLYGMEGVKEMYRTRIPPNVEDRITPQASVLSERTH